MRRSTAPLPPSAQRQDEERTSLRLGTAFSMPRTIVASCGSIRRRLRLTVVSPFTTPSMSRKSTFIFRVQIAKRGRNLRSMVLEQYGGNGPKAPIAQRNGILFVPVSFLSTHGRRGSAVQD